MPFDNHQLEDSDQVNALVGAGHKGVKGALLLARPISSPWEQRTQQQKGF